MYVSQFVAPLAFWTPHNPAATTTMRLDKILPTANEVVLRVLLSGQLLQWQSASTSGIETL
jgi:hypothetical protein